MIPNAIALGEADPRDRRALAQERLEEVVEGGLAERAEPEAGDRDPELAGGEVGVDVLDRVLDRPRARAGRRSTHAVDLTRAQAGDRELGGHEEAVRGDEQERQARC